jgi:3-deoxy-D-arabino-heptulosonate 7-phosphate (DAHP) synthase
MSYKKPFIIAGPCGVESKEQMQFIASSFLNTPVDMIRGGAWKPRSQPGHFEGLGEEALQWLCDARAASNKKVCTEVATVQQATLAMQYQLDAVWIGARTTVNPFLVQELADVLQGTSMQVLIKNPVNPDVNLWSGAVERFQKKSIQHIALIHRGFSVFDASSIYRNKPLWAIPIEMKRRFADLPLICDVSHIAGKRDILLSVAQRAMDLNFDGLMIETHPNPQQALSDAQQQITPVQLFELLNTIIIRHNNSRAAEGVVEEIEPS